MSKFSNIARAMVPAAFLLGCAAPTAEPAPRAEERMNRASVEEMPAGVLQNADEESASCTTNGDGTWGSILELCGSISGNYAYFTVTKTNGAFIASGKAHLKVGSPVGPDHDEQPFQSGASSVVLSDDLSKWSGTYPKEYYVRIESSVGGYAWVGPLTIQAASQ